MKAINNLYYSTKDLFVSKKNSDELDNQEVANYINSIVKENKELKEENTYLKNYNDLLQNANLNLKFTKDILETKLEEFTDREEIKEILDTDKPLDKTNKLIDKIEKLEDSNETYKEIIKTMCNDFDINIDSVLNIVDNISRNKQREIQRV